MGMGEDPLLVLGLYLSLHVQWGGMGMGISEDPLLVLGLYLSLPVQWEGGGMGEDPLLVLGETWNCL